MRPELRSIVPLVLLFVLSALTRMALDVSGDGASVVGRVDGSLVRERPGPSDVTESGNDPAPRRVLVDPEASGAVTTTTIGVRPSSPAIGAVAPSSAPSSSSPSAPPTSRTPATDAPRMPAVLPESTPVPVPPPTSSTTTTSTSPPILSEQVVSAVRSGNVGTDAGPFGDHSFAFTSSGGPVSVSLSSACQAAFDVAIVGSPTVSGAGIVEVGGEVAAGEFSVSVGTADDPGPTCAYSITVIYEAWA